MQNYRFILAFMVSLIGINISPAQQPKIQQPFAVAFDFDGVLFHGLSKKDKLGIATHIHPCVWRGAYQQWRDCGTGSLYTWVTLCEKHGDKRGRKYIEDSILSKKVYPTTEYLIRALDRQGYLLFRATNQDHREIMLHAGRLPAVFTCFTDGVEVDDTPGNIGLKKPGKAYFRELKRIMRTYCDDSVQLIFIDDKEDNVKAARQEGFIGILCKNPARLPSQLRALGLVF
jgi:FMN phosphatase YigB (HAD superfamily)